MRAATGGPNLSLRVARRFETPRPARRFSWASSASQTSSASAPQLKRWASAIPALARLVANLAGQQSSEVRCGVRALAQERPTRGSFFSIHWHRSSRCSNVFSVSAVRLGAEAMAKLFWAPVTTGMAFPDLQPERLLYKVYWALDAPSTGLKSRSPRTKTHRNRRLPGSRGLAKVLASCSGTDANPSWSGTSTGMALGPQGAGSSSASRAAIPSALSSNVRRHRNAL